MIVRLLGIASSIAGGSYGIGLLGHQGLELVGKADFEPNRKGIPRVSELSNDERNALVDKGPQYGNVVCTCETVTEGEVVEAVKRGPRTIKGIQYRNKAGIGRCQNNICGFRFREIVARRLNVPIPEVTKHGPGSKELLYGSR